jgi:hypothetical protein
MNYYDVFCSFGVVCTLNCYINLSFGYSERVNFLIHTVTVACNSSESGIDGRVCLCCVNLLLLLC